MLPTFVIDLKEKFQLEFNANKVVVFSPPSKFTDPLKLYMGPRGVRGRRVRNRSCDCFPVLVVCTGAACFTWEPSRNDVNCFTLNVPAQVQAHFEIYWHNVTGRHLRTGCSAGCFDLELQCRNCRENYVVSSILIFTLQ